MRFIPYLFLFLAINACATAQRGTGGDLNKKDRALLETSRAALDRRQWREAISNLDELIQRQPGNEEYYYLRSLAHKSRYQFSEAASDIRKGIEVADKPAGRPFAELGEVLSLAGDFPGALAAYQQYYDYQTAGDQPGRQLAKAEDLLRRATIADSIARNPVEFSPTPVPGLVNTKESFEYHPTISVDGERLIFTRRVNKRQEDFYFSERLSDGSWGEAAPLPGINTEYDEGAQTVTADGNYMVYTSCNQPGARPGCDLYESFWEGERWSKGRPIAGNDVNTEFYEAQPTLSFDGRFLLFSSKRPGGKGGGDLYISGRDEAGGWSRPAPLATLNTEGDEQYPFWAADGRSLYFTSNGLPGLGGDDIYYSTLGGDNRFSSPTNLGYPINTAENETNMFIPLDATVAYYSKRYFDEESETTQIDLWQFPLPQHLRPRPATYVRALVTDLETGRGISANVRIQPTDDSALARVQRTDGEGHFLTVLPAGADYAFTVDREGYLFQSERFRVAEGRGAADPYLVEIKLRKVTQSAEVETNESDGSIAFTNVLFPSGSADLLPVSFAELDRLADILSEQPALNVELAGHTDDVGPEAANLDLSERRAEAVKAYLIKDGIEPDRITAMGYGEANPVASNETEEGRSENRRTTFKLVDGNR